eukprot:7609373-Karenia_brevis.AAC.1
MAVLTGALWPGDRLEESDRMHNSPHCQRAGYDEIHMFHTCPALTTSRHPMMQKTQHLAEVARRDNYNPP